MVKFEYLWMYMYEQEQWEQAQVLHLLIQILNCIQCPEEKTATQKVMGNQ